MSPEKTPPRNTGQPHVSTKTGSHKAASLANVTVRKVSGPGQTWMNLTKTEVEDYKHSHAPQDKQHAEPSLLRRLTGLFKRKSGPGS
jgi:hypothetical protein